MHGRQDALQSREAELRHRRRDRILLDHLCRRVVRDGHGQHTALPISPRPSGQQVAALLHGHGLWLASFNQLGRSGEDEEPRDHVGRRRDAYYHIHHSIHDTADHRRPRKRLPAVWLLLAPRGRVRLPSSLRRLALLHLSSAKRPDRTSLPMEALPVPRPDLVRSIRPTLPDDPLLRLDTHGHRRRPERRRLLAGLCGGQRRDGRADAGARKRRARAVGVFAVLWLHLCRRDGCVLLHRAADAQVPAEEVGAEHRLPASGQGGSVRAARSSKPRRRG